ncbi:MULTISPECIES: GNAT family N-acetyltransferase [unclassified Mycobacterium]|uniref:GNAT family N-acetyltransferase n=1 Tax=unclassified Mycobacterium TaxID=2642494 RepID=UPI0007FBF2F1|nr:MULTISPECIES: GNAT family N-acetyltransferase [unclassified Mycobacterium]OBG72828.1 acetyltransferase [Mycobacterium sp. E1214]OBH22703.1 acetyltransferase [Mycobacterium sp. E1319]
MESVTLRLATADHADTHQLAELAAQTFSLACPPSITPEDIASFVATHLSAERFAHYLADPDRAVITATRHDRMLGYAMMVRGAADGTAELSKIYVLSEQHGRGVATALLERAFDVARRWGVTAVWLGVNRENERAQRFYTKSGFTVTGTRTFRVGGRLENDFVMTRRLR